MKLEQVVTLRLTEAECCDYVIELGELEGIADSLSPGGLNTQTGLVTLRRLRDLFEAHGLGVRQAQMENEVPYLRDRLARAEAQVESLLPYPPAPPVQQAYPGGPPRPGAARPA